jgi:hypothetical protein
MKPHVDSDTDGEYLTITMSWPDILAVDIDDVAAAAWAAFAEAMERYLDGQRAARAYDQTRREAFNDSLGRL